jgi:hypothetical protein
VLTIKGRCGSRMISCELIFDDVVGVLGITVPPPKTLFKQYTDTRRPLSAEILIGRDNGNHANMCYNT